MIRTTARRIKQVFASLCFSMFAISTPARADQQLWAAAYVDWTFPAETPGVELAQDLRIAQASTASFFTLNWDFVDGEGGYIGLQSDETGAGNARFSLWNATAARGVACRNFDGEGEGMTCVTPVSIAPDKTYRVRVTRGERDAQGQWWIGWIEERNGARREIGALRVAAQMTTASASSVHNFSEYWGDAVAACRAVPLSAAAFGPPALTSADRRAITAARPQGRRPEGHPCRTGREKSGAVARHTAIPVTGAAGMLVTLGGDARTNNDLAKRLAAETPR